MDIGKLSQYTGGSGECLCLCVCVWSGVGWGGVGWVEGRVDLEILASHPGHERGMVPLRNLKRFFVVRFCFLSFVMQSFPQRKIACRVQCRRPKLHYPRLRSHCSADYPHRVYRLLRLTFPVSFFKFF